MPMRFDRSSLQPLLSGWVTMVIELGTASREQKQGHLFPFKACAVQCHCIIGTVGDSAMPKFLF